LKKIEEAVRFFRKEGADGERGGAKKYFWQVVVEEC
jgi:hypothetical protein